jgi:hypothetical protein
MANRRISAASRNGHHRKPNRRRGAHLTRPALAFESLEKRFLLAADFGDAPDPYRTLLLENGARHEAVGAMLGLLRDTEVDGLPSVAADGDGADDDGIVFGPIRVGQGTANITVTVSNLPAGPSYYLEGWIDFDGDGNWGAPSDHVLDNKPLTAGTHQLTISVPNSAVAGTTYARFRLASNTIASPHGAVGSGEVEDYAVTILPPHAGAGDFTSHNVPYTDSVKSSINAVHAADVDADGDQDLIFSDSLTNRLLLHENDGTGTFTQRPLSTARGRLATADINGDGRLDIFTVPITGGAAGWLQSTPTGGYEFLSTGSGIAAGPIDVDGDGDLDVVTAAVNSISWRETGGPLRTIDSAATQAIDVAAADIDRDGDIDILGTSAGNNTVAWYQNNGSQTFTRTIITTDAPGLVRTSLVDFDRDGDLDVLALSSTGDINWFENDGAQNFSTRSVMAVAGAKEISTADIDADGDLDVLVAASGPVAAKLLRNDGAESFTAQNLSVGATDGRSIVAADIDGDGVLDIVVGSATGNRLAWLGQQVELDYGDAPTGYPTTAAEGGARHYPAGPTLGSQRDAEADGAHSSAADADGADEDGVSFTNIIGGTASAGMIVDVQNAAVGARLNAWIDFDGDGLWNRPEEHIAVNLAVVDGSQVVTFAAPAWAVAGTSVARVRISTSSGLGPVGAAPDGEVEDYAVTIGTPEVGTGVLGASQTVAMNVHNGGKVIAADLDRDGDMDFIAPGLGPIQWFQNNGAGAFTQRSLTSSGFGTVDFVTAADFDNDGDMDMLARVNTTAYHLFRNNGAQTFTSSNIANIFDESTVPTIVDFDSDGDQDLVFASSSARRVTLYRNNGGGSFVPNVVYTSPSLRYRAIAAGDADGDGDLDLFTAPDWTPGTGLELLINDGNDVFTPKSVINNLSSLLIFRSLLSGDMDGDGDLDLVAMVGQSNSNLAPHQLGWIRNDGANSFSFLPLSNLSTSSSGVVDAPQFLLADLEGDGDLDIVTSSPFAGRIAWQENVGAGVFVQRTISVASTSPFSNLLNGIAIGDVNGDGRADLFIASKADSKISWRPQLAEIIGDYGDAPYPYAVRPSAKGPIHQAVGPTLGVTRDAEPLADNSPDSIGDGTDDDGVTFAPIQPGQIGATVTVTVSNAPTGAYLDAWLDFDGDGAWGRAEEWIAQSVAVVEGANAITFDVPAWAAAGVTYARLRLSTAGGLGHLGPAADGEVEDYAVTIAAPTAAVGVYLERHEIAADGNNARFVLPVDLDRDGDLDVVTSLVNQIGIHWYENQGAAGYVHHTIDGSGLTTFAAAPADMDGDGDVDLVVSGGGIHWLENDGAQQFTPRFTFGFAPSSSHLSPADVDGDGDMDVLTSSGWFMNNGEQAFLSVPFDPFQFFGTTGITVDLDRDGDLDVVTRATRGGVSFFANDENTFGSQVLFSNITASVTFYSAVDIDGDGDVDLLGTNSSGTPRVRWYKNEGQLKFTEHILADNVLGVFSTLPADYDGDGDVDFIVSAQSEVLLYENNGEQQFTAHKSTSVGGAVALADMDADGRLDLVLSSLLPATPTNHGLAWYSITNRRVSLAATSLAATEEDQPVIMVSLTREGDVSQAVEFHFNIEGTATLGADYSLSGPVTIDASSGSVQFAAGQTAVEFQLAIADDEVKERLELLNLQLLPAPGYAVGVGTLQFVIDSAELEGDFNDDQIVDGADFLVWQRTLGAAADPPGSGADGDYDGVVDGDDLHQHWRLNFGDQVASAAPEAAAFAQQSVAAPVVESPLSRDVVTGVLSSPLPLSLSADEPGGLKAKRPPRHEAIDEVFRRTDWAAYAPLRRRHFPEGGDSLAAEKPHAAVRAASDSNDESNCSALHSAFGS